MADPMTVMSRGALFAGLIVLTACGGGGSGGSGGGFTIPTPLFTDIPPGVDSRETLFNDATAALEARSNTAFVEPFIEGIPTSDEIDFLGLMYVNAATPGTATELYGQANLTADFTNSVMTGTLTDFFGTDRTGSEAAYSGSLTVSGGAIGKPALAQVNDFAFDYGGSLNGNGEDIALSGAIDGKFKADPIRGLLGADASPTVTIDGDPFAADVSLTATRLP